MLLKTHFKKLLLVQHVQSILKISDLHHLVCVSILLSFCSSYANAQQEPPSLDQRKDTAQESEKGSASIPSVTQNTSLDTSQDLKNQSATDSMQLLEQQQKNPALTDFKPIDLSELENLPVSTVDPKIAQEIDQAAAAAKQQAIDNRKANQPIINTGISPQTQQQLTQIDEQAVNVTEFRQSIEAAHNNDIKNAREGNSSTKGAIFNDSTFEIQPEKKEEKGFFKRLVAKLKPTSFSIPKITAEVEGAGETLLATNIKNKLSTFTQEAFEDYTAALPQLRSQATQAAQAVGYYDATFKFQKLSNTKVKVIVTPNEPVKVQSQNIEFTGAGENEPQFQVIRLIPELDVGSILNQGSYDKTKLRITDVASDNGYFDGYWRLHDLRIQRPENVADINLKYETGERYKLANVEFRMSDPKKPFPLRMSVLKSLVPWQPGDDYTSWRINTLANGLTNSRYFNWSLVETIKPDPLTKVEELPPDIQKLVDERKITKGEALATNPDDEIANQADVVATPPIKQNVVDEKSFAGTENKTSKNKKDDVVDQQDQQEDDNELAAMKADARKKKEIPVVVTLNADKLNSAELGVGFGTDTGVRLRTQYRRAIVNSYGHAFDANMELSQIRQAIDTHYTIPYKHPINDYFNLVTGYEREEFTGVGPSTSLTIQSGIAGAERVIRNPIGGWQHTFGFRYRLDKIQQVGNVNSDDIPAAFLRPGSNPNQQALLFGYQLSKTDSNDAVNPVKGFKQNYKIQLGSKSVVSDANMAILSADWGFLYSLGENYNHQFVLGAQVAYIFTDDFNNVPYNLRFFAGGDQSLRGFDYKTLSPEENGYRIGGQALAVGSVEYNYQFKPGWRAAVFTDFGNAFDKTFSNSAAYSVGLGIRWQSPIGPIRLDIASGISDPGRPIRLHFFIGSQI
ncbi:autotransporter assembly complex protein TamA [Acinetobacter apis]|uniref:Translocation and assembly module subunit TamA n=1 Tax=Acinetobacter apis TaxID=1229165 RepID=A0A217EES1_9GAMM|nr:autotransporter assembly complex family protein [Acinetobacter apis]SNQ28792.1 autotransporter secretion outer membrane protein TamA [Acinetobacter apis]